MLFKYFKTCIGFDSYIKERNKFPPFYISDEGGMNANASEVLYHHKVQEDLKLYKMILGRGVDD